MTTEKTPTLALFMIIIIGIFGIISAYATWSVWAPAVPLYKLGKLRDGMSEEEVLKLLGTPRQRQTKQDGTEIWRYGHKMKWYELRVNSSDGEVQRFVHDD